MAAKNLGPDGCEHKSSRWVKIRLYTENQLRGYSRVKSNKMEKKGPNSDFLKVADMTI